mmetsp:Transcript_59234/g.152423  ORF Transcript_59234/g.152423 Transcript_59234/m.152423 type:complete len:287 (-) Transcript_59234:766-1626(-)
MEGLLESCDRNFAMPAPRCCCNTAGAEEMPRVSADGREPRERPFWPMPAGADPKAMRMESTTPAPRLPGGPPGLLNAALEPCVPGRTAIDPCVAGRSGRRKRSWERSGALLLATSRCWCSAAVAEIWASAQPNAAAGRCGSVQDVLVAALRAALLAALALLALCSELSRCAVDMPSFEGARMCLGFSSPIMLPARPGLVFETEGTTDTSACDEPDCQSNCRNSTTRCLNCLLGKRQRTGTRPPIWASQASFRLSDSQKTLWLRTLRPCIISIACSIACVASSVSSG